MPFRKAAIPRLLALVLVAGGVLLLAACDPNSPQSTFGPEGPIASRQLSLFWLIFWMAVAVFIVVEGVLLYAIIRYRQRPGQQGLPPQSHGHRRMEIAWTIAPVVVLVIIAIPTFITIAEHNEQPTGEDVIKVDVVGHQWWWEFRYPDLGVVTANEMHVPVDAPVSLTLLSGDVLHSFWVPKLAGKTDVFPISVTPRKMWFVANKPDSYFGLCAELCGFTHANMRFRVIAQPKEEFDEWVRGQLAPPLRPPTELAVQGSQIFNAEGCASCHSVGVLPINVEAIQQEARMGVFLGGGFQFPAPNLTSFGIRTTFAGAIEESTTENLRRWLQDPDDIKPFNHMAELADAYRLPANQLTNDEIDALVAYLQSLQPDLDAVPPTPTPTQPPTPTPLPGEATATPPTPGGEVTLQIASAGNELRFDKDSFSVAAGAQVQVILVNNATSAALQHNWVLVKAGTEDAVATAGLTAGPANNWVTPNDPDVIKQTGLIDGGKLGEATFAAPPPGTYAFVCTFPGHGPTMRGVFEVK